MSIIHLDIKIFEALWDLFDKYIVAFKKAFWIFQ